MRGFARRALVVATVVGILAGCAITAQAFTLIPWPKPTVTVTPTSGLPTATFRVRGKQPLPNGAACPVSSAPPSVTFKFYWYKVISNKVLIWSTTTNNCSASKIDTGGSPNLKPPTGMNAPGTYVIQVITLNPTTGAPYNPNAYSNTTVYRVLAPKPSPRPSPTPATSPPPCGQVGTAPCPSPTPSACTVGTTGMAPAPPGGRDAAVMMALLAFGALPIGGIVLFSSPAAWNRRRWSQMLALLGLSLILLTAGGCAAIVGQQNPTPSQTEPSPSPSPSPTC